MTFAEDYGRLVVLIGELPAPEMAKWVRRTFGPDNIPEIVEHLRFNEKCVAQIAEPCDTYLGEPTEGMVRARIDDEASSALTLGAIRDLIAALEGDA